MSSYDTRYLTTHTKGSFDEGLNGVSMGLTVSRKTAKNLAVRRKNERILTVSRKKNVNRKKILTTK